MLDIVLQRTESCAMIAEVQRLDEEVAESSPVPCEVFRHIPIVYSSADQWSAASVPNIRSDAYGRQGIMNTNGTVSYTPSDFGNFVGFTGRYHDWETGLVYFRARYFDTGLGRFIGRDPLGYVDGTSLYNAYFIPNTLDSDGTEEGPPVPPGPPRPNIPPPPNPSPFLPDPNQKPPGWNPSWPNGTDNRGPYTQDPATGDKWYPHPEDNSHWPHYDKDDNKTRFPKDSVKPRPGQQKCKPGQSFTDPWLDTADAVVATAAVVGTGVGVYFFGKKIVGAILIFTPLDPIGWGLVVTP
jgi:RHS repeat-associated protein